MMEEESEGSGSRDEHTWRGDGRRQVVTSPLKGYEEYEAIQVLLPSGPQQSKRSGVRGLKMPGLGGIKARITAETMAKSEVREMLSISR